MIDCSLLFTIVRRIFFVYYFLPIDFWTYLTPFLCWIIVYSPTSLYMLSLHKQLFGCTHWTRYLVSTGLGMVVLFCCPILLLTSSMSQTHELSVTKEQFYLHTFNLCYDLRDHHELQHSLHSLTAYSYFILIETMDFLSLFDCTHLLLFRFVPFNYKWQHFGWLYSLLNANPPFCLSLWPAMFEHWQSIKLAQALIAPIFKFKLDSVA